MSLYSPKFPPCLKVGTRKKMALPAMLIAELVPHGDEFNEERLSTSNSWDCPVPHTSITIRPLYTGGARNFSKFLGLYVGEELGIFPSSRARV